MAHNGTEVEVAVIPDCDICKHYVRRPAAEVNKAAYDLRTKNGQWGYVCEEHRKDHAMHADLGTGKGQRLILSPV